MPKSPSLIARQPRVGWRTAGVAALGVTLAATTLVPAARASEAPLEESATWEVTAFPSEFGGLSGVDVGGEVAVAVGFGIVDPFRFTPLAAAWDGEQWDRQRVRLRLGRGDDTQITDVDLLSDHAGWLVGHSFSSSGQVSVAARWNGSRWRGTPTDALTGDIGLHGVAAVSQRNAWAVGQEQVGFVLEPAIAHWDGTTWSPVDAPPLEDVGKFTALTSVAAESADSVWAVGQGGVALHFDGEEWSQVALPKVGGLRPEFQEVRVFGPDDVWAVGYLLHDGGARNPVALSWDGETWHVVDTPTDLAQLNDVARTAGGSTVSIGYSEAAGGPAFYGLRLDPDGPASPLALPNGNDALFGAAAGPDGDLWVVGSGAVGTEGHIAPFAAVRR